MKRMPAGVAGVDGKTGHTPAYTRISTEFVLKKTPCFFSSKMTMHEQMSKCDKVLK